DTLNKPSVSVKTCYPDVVKNGLEHLNQPTSTDKSLAMQYSRPQSYHLSNLPASILSQLDSIRN
ncbi:unnamed protein product, partial [Didymodactylos carnosus]